MMDLTSGRSESDPSDELEPGDDGDGDVVGDGGGDGDGDVVKGSSSQPVSSMRDILLRRWSVWNYFIQKIWCNKTINVCLLQDMELSV